MKQRISILLFVLAQVFFSLTICAEQRQASTWYGVQWYYTPWTPEVSPVITSLSYTLEGDTTINEIPYRKLLLTHEAENLTKVYRGALRQSAEKVYFVPNGSNKEYLLYDYSVNQGDTVYAYAGFNDKSCEELAQEEPDRTISSAWIVQDVGTIDGRKHVTLKDTISNEIEWIEGIGTKYILWPIGQGCLPTGNVILHRSLCAADSEGNILYSYDTDDLGIRNNNCEWEYINSSVKSTYIYFEDKNGLKDSLEIAIGLTEEEIDAIPTYSKDQVNQAAENGGRWVFITKDVLDYDYVAFRTVYVYEPYNMPIWFGQRRIFVPIDRLPITIRWNKQFFVENDLLGSFLSDWVTGMPDVGGDYEIASARLINYESCSFSYTYVGDLNAYYKGSSYDKLDGNVIYKMIDLYLGTQRNLDQDLRTAEESLSPATKIIREGHIHILRGNKIYTVTGQVVE